MSNDSILSRVSFSEWCTAPNNKSSQRGNSESKLSTVSKPASQGFCLRSQPGRGSACRGVRLPAHFNRHSRRVFSRDKARRAHTPVPCFLFPLRYGASPGKLYL